MVRRGGDAYSASGSGGAWDWRVQTRVRRAPSQMQSNMRPSYIVLCLEAGLDVLLSESLFEVSSYPHPRAVYSLPSVSTCAWSATTGFPS